MSQDQLSLLTQVSEVLLSSGDPDEVVGRLAPVIVPALGDWTFLTLVDEDGDLRDVGLAHRHPERTDDLQAYSDRHLQNMSDAAAIAVSLRTGEPSVVPRLSEEMLARFLPDPAVASLTRRLDPHGVAVFPLRSAERTYGVLVSVTTSPRGSHRPEELATLLEVSRRVGPVLGAARAARRAQSLAETMQRSLLQIGVPAPGLSAAATYRPAHQDREVGGDWYDLFTVDDGSTIATVGDVMGHDLAAIAAMAQLRSFMRANAWRERHSPAEMLMATDAVNLGLGPATFATAVTAELAPPAGDGTVSMRWTNAGHPPPALIPADGAPFFLGARELPDVALGVRATLPRTNRTTTLRPGDTLVLYTDGLVEQRGHDYDARLAELLDALHSSRTHDLPVLLKSVISALGRDDNRDDDIVLLAVRNTGLTTN